MNPESTLQVPLPDLSPRDKIEDVMEESVRRTHHIFWFESQGLILHTWRCMLGLKSAEQIIRVSDKISLDCLGRPRDRTAQGIYSAAHSLENRHAAAV